jgi:hypothetical protein
MYALPGIIGPSLRFRRAPLLRASEKFVQRSQMIEL